MDNSTQKEEIINNVIAAINGDIKKLNRDWFRSHSFEENIPTEHLIRKLWGSFTEFKAAVLFRIASQDTSDEDPEEIHNNEQAFFKNWDNSDFIVVSDNSDDEEEEDEISEADEEEIKQFSEDNVGPELEDGIGAGEDFAYAQYGYVDKGEYWYNPNTRDYLFDFTHIPCIAKPIVLPATQVYAILQAYSNFDKNPHTVNSIALKQKIPAFILKKVLYALSTTHDSLPITEELIDNSESDETVVDDLLSLRQFGIYEKFQQKVWKQVQEQSNKWVNFEKGILNPVKDIISTYQLPKIDEIYPKSEGRSSIENEARDQTYLITLSDLHFGSYANKANLLNPEDGDWTMRCAKEAMERYFASIDADISNRVRKPKDCVIISLGDLVHGLNGATDKGTPLVTQTVGIPQFKAALDALVEFFYGLVTIWEPMGGKIKVYAVGGNHDSIGDYFLMVALSKIFEGRIEFEIGTSRWMTFQIHNSLFVIEHGASSKYKAKVPTSDKAKEVYIQKLILDKMHSFKTPIEHKYFLMGDLHHYHQKEMGSFEFIQVPTIVKNDEYADALNLRSRPRQLTMVLNASTGIKETINHYFD